MSTGYLIKCMLQKCMRRKRSLILIFLGLFMAALGIITVASVARYREQQTPWYAQRTAKFMFEQQVSARDIYEILHAEYETGSVNGYALIPNVDTSGGISLGGIEGDLWNPVTEEDSRFSTAENLFWIHQQAVPQAYLHDMEGLRANIEGTEMECAGLTYYGLNWRWDTVQETDTVQFLLDGGTPHVESPMLENVYIGEEWIYIAPVIVCSNWMAEHDIPIHGMSITLSQPNDMKTLTRISKQLPAAELLIEWDSGRIGSLTANEWVYLGALVLAMLNVASLYYGLIDSFSPEFFIFRKIGARRHPIYLAMLLIVVVLSATANLAGWCVHQAMLSNQHSRQWLAELPVEYTIALFLSYVCICAVLSFHHTLRMMKTFRKKGSYL